MIKQLGIWGAAALFSLALHAGDYRIGEGVELGESPFYLGGYFSLQYWHNFKGTSEAALDDIAILLYGSEGAWNLMGEVEWSDVYRERFGFRAGRSDDLTPHAERVYAEYEPSEYFRTTLGKFNTPVGYWNRMPINVLRDTTSSPGVVSQIFPRFTTGADLRVMRDGMAFNVLAQVTPDLDTAFNPDDFYNNFDIRRQVGIGMEYEPGPWSFGVNAGGYEERIEDEEWGYLYASAQYRTERTRILAETGYRRNADNVRSYYGAYAQLTQALTPRHFAVVRLEDMTEYIEGSEDGIAIFGYTYRPIFPVALKGEYQLHSRENGDLLLVSFSMLF